MLYACMKTSKNMLSNIVFVRENGTEFITNHYQACLLSRRVDQFMMLGCLELGYPELSVVG